VAADQIPDAIGALERAKVILWTRLGKGAVRAARPEVPAGGKWITPEEVEARTSIQKGVHLQA